MFVEANPQYKTVNLYNSELKRLPKEELQLYTGKGQEKAVLQGEKKESKKGKERKNGNAVERPRPGKAKTTKRSAGH